MQSDFGDPMPESAGGDNWSSTTVTLRAVAANLAALRGIIRPCRTLVLWTKVAPPSGVEPLRSTFVALSPNSLGQAV